MPRQHDHHLWSTHRHHSSIPATAWSLTHAVWPCQTVGFRILPPHPCPSIAPATILTRVLPWPEVALSIAGYPACVQHGKACGLCNSRRRGSTMPTLKPDERGPQRPRALCVPCWPPAGSARAPADTPAFVRVGHLSSLCTKTRLCTDAGPPGAADTCRWAAGGQVIA